MADRVRYIIHDGERLDLTPTALKANLDVSVTTGRQVELDDVGEVQVAENLHKAGEFDTVELLNKLGWPDPEGTLERVEQRQLEKAVRQFMQEQKLKMMMVPTGGPGPQVPEPAIAPGPTQMAPSEPPAQVRAGFGPPTA